MIPRVMIIMIGMKMMGALLMMRSEDDESEMDLITRSSVLNQLVVHEYHAHHGFSMYHRTSIHQTIIWHQRTPFWIFLRTKCSTKVRSLSLLFQWMIFSSAPSSPSLSLWLWIHLIRIQVVKTIFTIKLMATVGQIIWSNHLIRDPWSFLIISLQNCLTREDGQCIHGCSDHKSMRLSIIHAFIVCSININGVNNPFDLNCVNHNWNDDHC